MHIYKITNVKTCKQGVIEVIYYKKVKGKNTNLNTKSLNDASHELQQILTNSQKQALKLSLFLY